MSQQSCYNVLTTDYWYSPEFESSIANYVPIVTLSIKYTDQNYSAGSGYENW